MTVTDAGDDPKVPGNAGNGDAGGPAPLELRSASSFRSQLTVGEDVVDPTTWAGAVPQAHGVAPRVRIGRNRWFNLLWLLPIGFVVLIVAVAAAKGLRNTTSVQHFIATNPGPSSRPAPSATPACRSGWGCSTSSTCSC